MPAVDRARPITVIGAGIGGLTVALELARLGFSVTVFERTPQLQEVGAGLQLSPNALRVLHRLGLGDALTGRGTCAQDVILRQASTGRRIASVPVVASDGTPYLSIHRADLQMALLRAVERADGIKLHLGASLEALAPSNGGVDLWIANPAGDREKHHADVVIGADGVHSSIARLLGLQDATPSGAIAWRCRLHPAQDISPPQGIEAWLGSRRHAVAYPISGGRETNLVLIEPAGQREQAEPSGLSERYRAWDRRLIAMIAKAGEITPWPLSIVPPNRPWRHLDDRLVLIGDAAHAMLPYAAQGAAMAIEDAAVLGDALTQAPTRSAALNRYEAARRPRIGRVRRRVLFHRFVYHLPTPFSLGRDAALSMRSPERLRSDLNWLYDWRPPSASFETVEK